jgi:hypothetical protein
MLAELLGAFEDAAKNASREADAQIREIDDWWRRNRTAAPDSSSTN